MPYTPPSHRSPASSAPSSPDVSRRSSFHGTGMSTGAGGAGAVSRPQLPRSASYLTKNRRTQPAAADAGRLPPSHGAADASTPDLTPPGTSDDLKGMAHAASVAAAAVHFNTGPVRQSPPPVTDGRTMPIGAIISPPDSQTSSEDEGASREPARGREIENLKELQDAISAIPQHRTSSPDRIPEPGDLLVLPSQIAHLAESQSKNPANRRISHARSHTEPNIFVSKSADASPTPSEADSEIDDPPQKPIMVRKKSGELVRPALRPAANRRPSSMPGTPTFSKAVHFDSHLEHVRHFLQVDRPLAVSAGSSPNDNYESDTEYPFNNAGAQSGRRSPPHEWELVIHNFPAETPLRRGMPIRVERLWMSPDQKCLIGSCSVANLAFQKSIVCRFTFDYWKTVSEITADFSHEIRARDAAEEGHDRFQFTIKLSDLANLESKTLYFCVRYNVNGAEYWDNNNGLNFQVDFRKKMLPQNGKKNFQGASSRPANALPRSNRRSNPNTAPRPKSMPVGVLDEFGSDHSMWDDGPLHEFLGESGPIRLKRSSKSTTSLPSDNLTNRLSAPSGLAFANRYDFGASLSAAKQASTGSPRSGDGLYMKPHKKASFGPPLQTGPPPAAPSKVVGPSLAPAMPAHAPGPASPASASIATASYEEIVNKYCFFNGSKQNSPQLTEGALRNGRYDGAADYSPHSSDSSANGSPEMTEHKDTALHHSLHQHLNPYFQHTHMAIGASPAESPLGGPPALGSRRAMNPQGTGSAMGGALSPLAEAHTSPAIRG